MEPFVIDTMQTATATAKCPMEDFFLVRLEALAKAHNAAVVSLDRRIAEITSACHCTQRLQGMQEAMETMGKELAALKARLPSPVPLVSVSVPTSKEAIERMILERIEEAKKATPIM